MTHRPHAIYLTIVRQETTTVLTILDARNEADAQQQTGRAEYVPPAYVEAVLIDSKVAYKTLRQWFKRPYVRALQYGAAESVSMWRFAVATMD